MPQLTNVTRQQFKDNVVTGIAWEPLPWWLQSGPFGWPMPFHNENVFRMFQEGIFAVNFGALPTIIWELEDALDRFKSWFQALSGECQDEDDLADKWEAFVNQDEFCEENGWSAWAEEE
jgi:hypothetical protein